MMRMVDPLLAELDQEAPPTRQLLARVPGDKLGWKPHAKSMSLGQLALHVATIPGNVAGIFATDHFEVPAFEQPSAQSAAELVPALEQSIRTAKELLGTLDDHQAMAIWKLVKEEKVLMAAPRIMLLRPFLLNHWYHHRGQLSVYLRLLDVPLPSIYGPSADENPFAGG